jgi:hypothetical protein
MNSEMNYKTKDSTRGHPNPQRTTTMKDQIFKEEACTDVMASCTEHCVCSYEALGDTGATGNFIDSDYVQN